MHVVVSHHSLAVGMVIYRATTTFTIHHLVPSSYEFAECRQFGSLVAMNLVGGEETLSKNYVLVGIWQSHSVCWPFGCYTSTGYLSLSPPRSSVGLD